MIEIRDFTNRVILLIVILLLIPYLEVEAAFFSDNMEKFIRDGKEVTVMLEEGIKEIKITPRESVRLSRVDDKQSIELTDDESYYIEVDRQKENFYKIQVFATSSREKADNIWLELLQMGFQEVRVEEGVGLYRVQLGKYGSKSETVSVITQLEGLGWNPWVVTDSRQLPEQISVYDLQGERIFAGTALSITGKLEWEDGLYSGTTYFQVNKGELRLLHQSKLENIVDGIVQSYLESRAAELEIEAGELNEFIMAYSIALRTYFIYNYLNNRHYSVAPYYRGIVDNGFINSSNNTVGIILVEKKENSEFKIPEIDFLPLSKHLDINGIISSLDEFSTDTSNYQLLDLKEINSKKVVVDAEIEWGLRYKEIRQLQWSGPVVYTLLELDLNNRRFYVEPVLAQDKISGLEDLGQMVKNRDMLAGVNGGFFHYSGSPLGLIYKDNNIIAEPVKDRTSLIITENNQIIFERVSWRGYLEKLYDELEINGINKKPDSDQIVIFNKYYGDLAPTIKAGMAEMIVVDGFVERINYFSEADTYKGTQIPIDGYVVQAHGRKVNNFLETEVGDFVQFKNNFNPDFKALEVKTAISAGPQLVKDSKVYVTAEAEEFQPDIAYGRAPRSSVGVTADNKLVFFTIDGRQPGHSIGVTLEEMAKFMKEYGITDGMNLDGGSSARMIVRGFTMNSPSGERLISNAILIGRKKILD